MKKWADHLQMSTDVAQRIRDGGIYALDELNLLYEAVAQKLESSDAEALRGALGLTSSAILDFINPLLARFPQLEPSDEEWGEMQ